MLAELAVTAALVLAPAAPADTSLGTQPEPTRGVVWIKWYDAHSPGFLGMPTGPECWGLQIFVENHQMDPSICVDQATWKNTPLFSYYEGGAA